MKLERYISFRSMDHMIHFLGEIEQRNERFQIISGQYELNAKSLMSLIYMGLKKPMKIQVNTESDCVKEIIERYSVKCM